MVAGPSLSMNASRLAKADINDFAHGSLSAMLHEQVRRQASRSDANEGLSVGA